VKGDWQINHFPSGKLEKKQQREEGEKKKMRLTKTLAVVTALILPACGEDDVTETGTLETGVTETVTTVTTPTGTGTTGTGTTGTGT
jgi:hypothetical protein